MQHAGAKPNWAIIDDGWQVQKGEALWDYRTADKEKFARGLADIITELRARGVDHIGVWHALQGYWRGIHPEGVCGGIPIWLATNRLCGSRSPVPLHLIQPDSAAEFYHTWYQWLSAQGVDFTKVDNQSALAAFSADHAPGATVMQAYQSAQQDAASTHLPQAGLHCMSHGSDVLLATKECNWMRNSQDY